MTDEPDPIHFPPRLRKFAERIGAEEYGVYFFVNGARMMIPFSLTEAEPPEPEPEVPASPAGPRPE